MPFWWNNMQRKMSDNNMVDHNKNIHTGKQELTNGFYFKARYSLALIQFFGNINLMVLRNNVSIAVVAMVNATSSVGNDVNSTSSCPNNDSVSSSQVSSNGVFQWNSAEQGLFLGCYFYGYVASSLPGAWLSKRFGMKYIVGMMTFVASVLTLCTPFVAYLSFELLIAVRTATGLFQGIISPVFIGSWGIWGPPSERSSLISFTASGTSVGTCLNLIVSGIIAENIGWEAVFYITGGGGLVWSVLWIFLVHDYPETHPRISVQEKEFIIRNTGLVTQDNKIGAAPPWSSMATSLPLWATCVGLFTSNWGNYTMMSMLPTYLATVLNFDLAESGYLSALPYLVKWILTMIAGYATSLAQSKTNISTGVLRRINQTVSLLTTALFLVLVGYVGCNATAAVVFFCIAEGANALSTPGCMANTVDIAPRYGEIMFGICNTIGNIAGFLTPQVIGFILLDSNSIKQWQIVFWMSAGIALFGVVFYLIFASGKEEKWAKIRSEDQKISKQEFDNQAFEDVSTDL